MIRMRENNCYMCGEDWTLDRRNVLYKVEGSDKAGEKMGTFHLCSKCIKCDAFIWDYIKDEESLDGARIEITEVDTAPDAIRRRS